MKKTGKVARIAPIALANAPGALIEVRRSARARRMTLRVSGFDRKITLTLPQWTPESEARGFVEAQRGWIVKRLAEMPPRRDAVEERAVPFEGRMCLLEQAPVRSARLTADGHRIQVPMNGPGRALRRYLMLAARQRLDSAATAHSARFGRVHAGITLRDTRSRWGSCSSAGRLSFSWRLIMAPSTVLDYVALHEAAHLVHMHHGPEFWALVEGISPGYRAERDWLREYGASLHTWHFDD